MNPALFLDRDGVIIENLPNYVRSWSDVFIYPQALRALQKIKESDYKIFILTNQSAVGRGIISRSTADEINQRLINEIETAGGRVDRVIMCPHTPEDNCLCRKPLPGMVQEAAALTPLDINRSIMIGDSLSDIIAGQTAGVGRNVLVSTGRGRSQLDLPLASEIPPFLVYKNLSAALSDLIP